MASAQDQIGLIMQLRRRGIRDNKVLRAIERVPRELFVDEAFADHAYQDIALPIECGQTISQPTMVARMCEELRLRGSERVLDVGTGSGYQAAVLSHLCRRVYTVERWRELQKAAEKRFAKLGITNVTTIIGDGWLGWPPQAPFDRIIVTAAPPESSALTPAGFRRIALALEGSVEGGHHGHAVRQLRLRVVAGHAGALLAAGRPRGGVVDGDDRREVAHDVRDRRRDDRLHDCTLVALAL